MTETRPLPVPRPAPAVRRRRIWVLCGPAFVAAVAYVDPGNVATNVTAGSRYGYRLLWVVVCTTALAGLIQYLAAKLGIVSGRTLPELCRQEFPKPLWAGLWLQAECVAIATDVAEVLGGALALYLLFDVPILAGAVLTGVVSTVLLMVQSRRGARTFEFLVVSMLCLVLIGFSVATVVARPSWAGMLGGMAPGLPDRDALVLAAAIAGATVMPHAIYLHTGLVRDRYGVVTGAAARTRLVSAARVDVVVAMAVAGFVNATLLVGAAATVHGDGVDTIEGAYAAYGLQLGAPVAVLLALGLLFSGLASSSVGTYAGGVILSGFLRRHVPVSLRRAITLIPAIAIIAVVRDTTTALVLSQLVLSIGIPFALVPLLLFTGNRRLMGEHRNGRLTTVLATTGAVLVSCLTLVAVGGLLRG